MSLTQPWYAARCLFDHEGAGFAKPRRRHVYEERIILVRASSDREAVRKAEKEARDYARAVDARYLGYVETFHTFESSPKNLSEVFCLMRSSNLSPEKFISRYFDDGSEHRKP